jgi:DNA polymerase zeta
MTFALVMEPKSGFYSDPVVVLDFQSLYPSALIAYNLCYCTTFGRTEIAPFGHGQMGVLRDFRFSTEKLKKLLDRNEVINTPNDVLFVKSSVRKGIMPILLDEILALRAFIKQTLKNTTDEKVKRVLEARQLALKLFAACAFGYTNANYTGRMPCVDLGDSIVEVSRHMLEFVINHLEKEYPELSVLYGDTDSLFIRLPRASKIESFLFAEKLCDEITSFFPAPVRIKLEKIYFGCFLVNKKRYCGWMYESASQLKPTLDIKGLEMKRRDSCVLVAKTMKDVIESIFAHGNADHARLVFSKHIRRICTGKVPLNEFMFAREVRLGSYRGIEPPGAVVARARMSWDPRGAPMFGERVQYLVIASAPGSRLIDRVVSPEDFMDKGHRISTKYYIDRQIVPALGRVLETMGININDWMMGLPRDLRKLRPFIVGTKTTALERFCKAVECPLCCRLCSGGAVICNECLSLGGKSESLFELMRRIKICDVKIQECSTACSRCIGICGTTVSECFCRGCDRFWEVKLAEEERVALDSYREAFVQMFDF